MKQAWKTIIATRVAAQPMPANQRKLGSLRKASLVDKLDLALSLAWETLLGFKDVEEALSSSTLRSFAGGGLMLGESRLFSGGEPAWLVVVVLGEVEIDVRRNKFGGAWLLEPEELDDCSLLDAGWSAARFGCD